MDHEHRFNVLLKFELFNEQDELLPISNVIWNEVCEILELKKICLNILSKIVQILNKDC